VRKNKPVVSFYLAAFDDQSCWRRAIVVIWQWRWLQWWWWAVVVIFFQFLVNSVPITYLYVEPFNLSNTAYSVHDVQSFDRIKRVFRRSFEVLEQTGDIEQVTSKSLVPFWSTDEHRTSYNQSPKWLLCFHSLQLAKFASTSKTLGGWPSTWETGTSWETLKVITGNCGEKCSCLWCVAMDNVMDTNLDFSNFSCNAWGKLCQLWCMYKHVG